MGVNNNIKAGVKVKIKGTTNEGVVMGLEKGMWEVKLSNNSVMKCTTKQLEIK